MDRAILFIILPRNDLGDEVPAVDHASAALAPPTGSPASREGGSVEKCIQFSVFLANKPGVLSQLFRALGKAKVNIKTLAMMDSTEHGVLRMIVEEPRKARTVLKKLEVSNTETDVLAITLPNRPGAAADLCEKLASAHMNIAYMYCAGGGTAGRTIVVFRVPDIAKAIKVLENNKAKGTRRDMKVKLRRPKAPVKRR